MGFLVKFWGVRGSIACPSPEHMVYGGNTSCVEVRAGDSVIIFDAGTGIRLLGQDLIRRNAHESTLFLTHTHWDHINGFPFFAPAFRSDFSLRIMAGHLHAQPEGIQAVLAHQMENPTFPVPLSAMKGTLTFEDFAAGNSIHLADDLLVRTAPLNHPNGATGYRIEHGGHAVCYVTDTEHTPGHLDETVLGLIAGADLLIYDCTYTDEEFPERIGWGHSTWQEAVRLCRAAAVKRLAIFHHDPDHTDSVMARIEDEARRTWPAGVTVARDGMELTLV